MCASLPRLSRATLAIATAALIAGGCQTEDGSVASEAPAAAMDAAPASDAPAAGGEAAPALSPALTGSAPAAGAVEEPGVDPPGRRPNVILISIDDLRRDRLGFYGSERPTSPLLDQLASESVVFDNAYSTSSWTLPSHASMFSGLHPKSHGATLQFTKPRADVRLLTEILRDEGYQTAAVTAGGWLSEGFGFEKGFDVFESHLAPGRGVRASLAQAKALDPDRPYFLFFHTFGVHCPFHVPPKYEKMVGPHAEDARFDVKGMCGDTHFMKMDLSDGQIAYLSDLYDAGIRRMDDFLARLIGFLKTRGDLDRSILVVTSDHGEEFREHGRMGHGRALYAESLRIPLFIRAPGLEPRRVSVPTSIVDLTPTLLELLDIEAEGMEGTSLVPRLRDGDAADEPRPVFAETTLRGEKARSVVFDGRQLIVDLKNDRVEMYDLAEDPEQRAPLAEDARSSSLDDLLAAHFADLAEEPDAVVEVTEERLEQLRALGYVE